MGDDPGELRRRWEACVAADVPAAVRDDHFRQLYSAYTAPDRHYHDIGHIADCLREFDRAAHLAHNGRAIQLAIWFHDVVYDGRRTDNEERSAEVAEGAMERLGATPALRWEVVELVLDTRHDREPKTGDGKLMVDIDLSSLALPPDAFDDNSRKIRLEYPHVAEPDFIRNRSNMLGQFLARPRIYYTDLFHDRYEHRARANLERVVAASRV